MADQRRQRVDERVPVRCIEVNPHRQDLGRAVVLAGRPELARDAAVDDQSLAALEAIPPELHVGDNQAVADDDEVKRDGIERERAPPALGTVRQFGKGLATQLQLVEGGGEGVQRKCGSLPKQNPGAVTVGFAKGASRNLFGRSPRGEVARSSRASENVSQSEFRKPCVVRRPWTPLASEG